MPSFGRHFCWEKMAAGVFTTGHLELKYFEINEIIFCIIERRDRVTFTGSIGTIFGGTNPKNYDFSPKCRRPPPKSTIFGMGLS